MNPLTTSLISTAILLQLISLKVSYATQVEQCSFGSGQVTNLDYSSEELSKMVRFGGCETPPCKVAKKTSVSVEIDLKPKKDTSNISNSIYGVLGIPIPYPGVYGTSACDHFWLKDGTKASCPLKAGVEYVYKNKFPVLEIYPEIPVNVHWALTDSDSNQDVICFEAQARIVAAKH